jgi:predicted tellurium resistance membrane protein TerC
MLFAAGAVSRFVDDHPTIKMLALSFLVLVGVALVAEGWGFHIPKGYIYFSMAFAMAVELLNMWMRKRAAKPVHLRRTGGP